MNNLLALPLVVPLTTASLCIVAWKHTVLQRVLSLLGILALLSSCIAIYAQTETAGIQVLRVGAWPAPYSIVLVADVFSGLMLMLAGGVGLMGVLYSLRGIDGERQRYGFHPLLHVMLMGVCGAFLTGDLFNLFVWFEVMLISSFVLLALGGERRQIEGAFKYVAINLVASVIFLCGIGLLYGATGTLNLAELAMQARDTTQPAIFANVSMLMLASFGIKAGLFPFFFWLPASYHTPPPVVAAVFAGLLAKVGAYAIFRTFSLIFVQDATFTQNLLLVIASITMVVGVLGAFSQYHIRRILAFHSVSQMGYILFGFALGTREGIAAAIFFILHHSLVKAGLFLVSDHARLARGSEDVRKVAGLLKASPWLAACFFVLAMSLTGIPPLSGFVGKLGLVQAGVAAEATPAVAVALAVGVFTLLSMLKIWNYVFWRAEKEPSPVPRTGICGAVLAAMAVGAVAMGLFAGPVYASADRAAAQLQFHEDYVRAVYGEGVR